MKLWLLRHARVLLPDGLCYGASDVPADGVVRLIAFVVAPDVPAQELSKRVVAAKGVNAKPAGGRQRGGHDQKNKNPLH